MPFDPAAATVPQDPSVAVLQRLMAERHSCRAFLPTPLDQSLIESVLQTAQRAASWCNSQAWQVTVVSGDALAQLREALGAADAAGEPPASDFPFPTEYRGAYLERRRECGFQLYGAVGIARGDREGYARQTRENFRFFGAPHVAILTCDPALGVYGAVDVGGYVQALLLSMQAHGVAAVPQAALATRAALIKQRLGIPAEQRMVCGVSFGREDRAHPANGFRTRRATLDEAVRFVDSLPPAAPAGQAAVQPAAAEVPAQAAAGLSPTTLDPADWGEFRAIAARMLDAAIDRMQAAHEGPVWREPPPAFTAALCAPLPTEGAGLAATQRRIEGMLPYGVGNTHPRFFGWVHGAGTPGNLVAEIAAAAINANLGGRHHGAMAVEQQVVRWCRELFGFPDSSSGLVVSGTSIATLVALKAARDQALGTAVRRTGLGQAQQLVGYTSSQAHSCVARAFDVLGLGADALRRIPVDAAFEMDLPALQAAIAADRAAGLLPFAVVGTAGSVNVGAIDDLERIADLAQRESLWFHVDGAFGACGVLSERLRPRLTGIRRADSLAFDFHKWLHVNYDAGFVLIRSEAAHRRAFSERPDYLRGAERGLAGGNPWPVEYGPELSRGFRALRIWTQIEQHGTRRLGESITRNCEQAAYLAQRVQAHPALELLAPVAMNICCFRWAEPGLDAAALDRLNDEIVVQLQMRGIAAPSATLVDGRSAIRVNITNHRTRDSDLDVLLAAVEALAGEPAVRAAAQPAAAGLS